MLPFDAGDRFVDVGQDCALEQELGAAFSDEPAEYVFIEGLGNGLAFFFRVRDSFKCGEEFFAGVDDFNGDAELTEKAHDLFGFSLAH